jgi:hypothetical protein
MVVIGTPGRGTALVDDRAGTADAVRAGSAVEDGAIGDFAAQPQRLGAGGRGQYW